MYSGGVNFTSLLFMNVYHIYILLVWFDQKGKKNFIECIYAPLLMIWQKGGEKFGVLYMHVYAWFPCFIQKGRKTFWEFYRCMFMSFKCKFIFFNWYESIYVLFSIGISAYMCHLFYAYIEYLYILLLCMS